MKPERISSHLYTGRPGTYRHEYKYLCDAGTAEIEKIRCDGLLERDPHAVDGVYRVRSLYFDTPEDWCLASNLAGINNRDKFRLRIYMNTPGVFHLEQKSKDNEMTWKTSAGITKEECESLLAGEYPVNASSEEAAALYRKMQLLDMQPKVIVEYLRTPFVDPSWNVRVTFDEDIGSASDISGFLDPDLMLRPVMESGLVVMEVKWDDTLPAFIQSQLECETLQKTGVSKYVLCRRYNLLGESIPL